MLAEMHFRSFYEEDPAIHHEAGHIAVALHFDKNVIILMELGTKGNGIAGIDISHFDEKVRYYIAIAGFLCEAKGMSNRDLDVDQVQQTIIAVRNGLKSKEPAFKIPVPVTGGGIKEASCSRDDFVWRRGEYDVASEFNVSLAEEVVKDLAAILNGSYWAKVEAIVKQIRETRKFRNGI